ncbi:hypothetical protein [Pandoraea commovens]|uniref:hypothetical protein n=1 Tax=Pandoraea commovens TaxID=2508289 RepID=UPI00124030D9|nr:hypothetical protein [Pandoraea commovens]
MDQIGTRGLNAKHRSVIKVSLFTQLTRVGEIVCHDTACIPAVTFIPKRMVSKEELIEERDGSDANVYSAPHALVHTTSERSQGAKAPPTIVTEGIGPLIKLS